MMKKLSISAKLFVSNLAYAVPIFVLVFFMLSTKNEIIDFAQGELNGDQYQKPLQSLLNVISQHGILAQRALHGDAQSRGKLADVETKIESALTDLESVDQKLGPALQFTDAGLASRKREQFRPSIWHKEWGELKSQLPTLKAEQSNDKHLHLVAGIRGMITHLGDTSNLILDPDLDSYYLMDITLGALPQMQDRIQEIILKTEPILRSHTLSAADRIQTAVYSALLKQSDWDRITGDAQTAVNEDKNFNGLSPSLQKVLPATVAQTGPAIEALIKQLDEIVQSDRSLPSAERFLEAAEKALNLSHQMSATAIPELDTLLNTRLTATEHQKRSALLFSLLALVLAAIVSTFFGLSIKHGVIDSVSEAVIKIRQVTDSFQATNANLAQTSQSLSMGTTQQAAAIQETVATLNEINAMVGKSVGNAESSAQEASRSQAAALQGKEAVAEMVTAISEISESNDQIMRQIEESNRQITEIVHVITEIGTRTKVINDIVFQTKLLSFNASVEAARAGEHGKGFAVVAEEVGNLAQMSGNAAKEISDMLNASIQKVNGIVDNTKSRVQTLVTAGKAKVDGGILVAQRCGTVLEEVVNNISNVNHMMVEIVEASKQQAQGVDEITKAMNSLDEVTHQNSSTSQQTAEYAAELTEQTQALKDVVAVLEMQVSAKSNADRYEALPSHANETRNPSAFKAAS